MITAFITDHVRHETVAYIEKSDWDESADYGWSDGSFGCDCNRALFFSWAAQIEEIDIPCGDDRYGVAIYNEKSELVYSDNLEIPS